jgi:DNA-binding GntR family transcriptional regulator
LKAPQPDPPQSLVKQAYDRIKRDILDGHAPPGSQLSEHQLAEDLGISRTPIREALRDLASSGLVRIMPQRGIVVSELSLRDISDMYALREQLECFAVQLAVPRLDEANRAGFLADHAQSVAALHKRKLREAYDYAVRMHARIIRIADSPRLQRFMSQLADEAHRYGLITLRAGHAAQAIGEHGHIISAMLEGDGERAARLMLDHLRCDRDLALKSAIPQTALPPGDTSTKPRSLLTT